MQSLEDEDLNFYNDGKFHFEREEDNTTKISEPKNYYQEFLNVKKEGFFTYQIMR